MKGWMKYPNIHQATYWFLGINEGYKLVMVEIHKIGKFIEKFDICVVSVKL